MKEQVSILLLEDDDELREQLADSLSEEGYQVDAVGSGQQAVQLAGSKTFDLVLTDIRMPGIDGLEALRQVRDQQPEVRSLVLTGYSSEADSVRAIQLGVGEYLKKPFRLDAFLQAVGRLVTQRREQLAQQELQSALLHTARSAMDALMRLLPGEQERWLASGPTASRLALQLGRSQLAAEQLGVAAQAAALHEGAPEILESLPAHLRQTASTGLALAQEQLDEEEQSGADAELIGFSLCLAGERPVDRFGSDLQDAWKRSHAGAPAEVRRHHGLLSLARGLEDGGDLRSAATAYTQVLADSPHSHEGLEAWLGRARLAQRQGQGEELRQAAESAFRLGSQLGPVAGEQSALEVGLLLAPAGSPQGRACLERVVSGGGGAALARLALGHFYGQTAELAPAVEQLLAPNAQEYFVQAQAWLPQALLKLQLDQPDPILEKACRRLARDGPGRFLEVAKSPGDTRLRALAVRYLPGDEQLRELLGDPEAEVRRAATQALEQSEAETGPPQLRLYSFGSFSVFLGEERVPEKLWRSINVRWILARLAAARGKPVPTEVLVDEFWPEEGEAGKRNLYWATSVLRRCLTPAHWQGELEWVERTQQGLRLNSSLPHWHDLDVFLEADSSIQGLRQVLSAYRGPYLEGCYMEWALQIRAQCERQVLEAARQLATLTLSLQRYPECVEACARLLELDSCCQDAYQMSMQAHTALSRPEESLRLYETARKILHRELGLEPSIELMREQQRALLAIP
ncbi:hypothetical protein ABS71_05785 [bacterium SCN 62-11]|nr:MAG: hypothetical protein ABS71_05785 [bacterium SCN 62-11]